MVLKEIDNFCVDFEEEVGCNDNFAICGNWRFKEIGDKTILDIIKGDYYDDDLGYDYEPLEMLKKYTNKDWDSIDICGYSQGEWNRLYYTNDISNDMIDYIECIYMGKYDAFSDEDNCYYVVPHSVVWNGKQAIVDYLGIGEIDTILKIDGYTRVASYKEI